MYISEKAKRVKASSTLAIDSKFKAMKAEGIDVVGFGTGEPDFDTPDDIKAAAIDALNRGITKYTPASGTLDLKKAVCRKLLRDNGLTYQPTDIVISNGAKHSLVNAFMAICNPGDEVIIPAPYWVSYPEMVKLADGVPVIVNAAAENNFKVAGNATSTATVNGAERGDTFVLTITATDANSNYVTKNVTVTVGADTNAKIVNSTNVYVNTLIGNGNDGALENQRVNGLQ